MMADMKGLSKTKNAQVTQTCGLENLNQITTLNSHPVMLYRILVFVINSIIFPWIGQISSTYMDIVVGA